MSDIKQVLQDHSFKFNKQFGQNFITDTNLLQAMVKDSGIQSDDTVVGDRRRSGNSYKRDRKSGKEDRCFRDRQKPCADTGTDVARTGR